MASTTAQPIEKPEVQPQDPPVEPPKRGRGRPRTSSNAENEGESDQEPFFLRIKGYSAVDWQEVLQLYLFRCQPYFDRKATGQHANLRKYLQPVEPEEIKQEFGSGQYKLMLVALDRATGKYHKVEEHYFVIMDMNYPPQLPVGDWLDDKRNADWAWSKPLLEAAQRKKVMETQGVSNMQGMDQATQMFQAAVSAVKTLRPDESPEKQTSLAHMIIQTLEKTLDKNASSQSGMLEIVNSIISAVKPSGDGSSDIVKILLVQMEAAEKRAEANAKFSQELLMKMNEPKPQQSFKEQLLDWKEILGSMRGSPVARGGTDWPEVVKDVGGEIVKTIGAGLQFAAMKKAETLKRQPQPAAHNPQLTPPSPAQPTATPTASNPPKDGQLTPEQLQNMKDNMVAINNEYGWLFDEIAPEVSNIFMDGEVEGVPAGIMFREWFLKKFGDYVYDRVKKFSAETIMTLIEIRKQQGDPTVQVRLQTLQPPEKVAQFIQEFLSDEPYEPDDEDEPETPDEKATGKTDF